MKKQKEKIIGIYGIQNIINNKIYIGKSKDIKSRWKGHITYLNCKYKKQENQHFISAWHKYKKEGICLLNRSSNISKL